MPKVDKEYSETISLRLTKGQQDKLRAAAEASGLSQSDYLRQLIDDDCVLRLSDLSGKMLEKLKWRQRARRRATIKELVLEALRQGLGLSRWE
ncbi:MAG: hypothetical protein DRN90_00645 [Thermoproteota archaeon]|nr:MAG: hypothetical protein DRG83_01275 [Deltaproteobacteria bacterium]RLG49893.1 MAG: hypothetical protein DRN90_00645 [Candidatus Korarchaeota archaeon]